MSVKTEDQIARKARELYLKGLGAHERENDPYAIEMLMATLQLEPAFLAARNLLRTVQIRHYEQFGRVKQALAKARAGGPTTKAATLLKRGDKAQAVIAAEEALCICPYHTAALKVLAEATTAMDHPEAAVAALQVAHEQEPKDFDVLHRLAQAFLAMRDPAKAMECLQELRELRPGDPDVERLIKNMSATATMQRGRWDQEGSYRDKAKDLDEARLLEQRNRVMRDTDDLALLLQDARRQLEAHPENLGALRTLVNLAIQKREFETATAAIDRARQAVGEDPMLDRLASEVRGKRAQAQLDVARERLKADPDNAELRATVERAEKDWTGVLITEVEARAAAYPNDLDIKFELGELYFRASRVDEAIREFQQAQQSSRHRLNCLSYLGRLFAHKGMFDLAASQLERAVAEMAGMDSGRKEVLYALGGVYEQMGDRERAIVPFKEIFEADITYRDVAKKVEEYYRHKRASGAPPS